MFGSVSNQQMNRFLRSHRRCLVCSSVSFVETLDHHPYSFGETSHHPGCTSTCKGTSMEAVEHHRADKSIRKRHGQLGTVSRPSCFRSNPQHLARLPLHRRQVDQLTCIQPHEGVPSPCCRSRLQLSEQIPFSHTFPPSAYVDSAHPAPSSGGRSCAGLVAAPGVLVLLLNLHFLL